MAHGYLTCTVNEGGYVHEGETRKRMEKLYEDQQRYMYRHELGFWYVKLSDNYFTLPREVWRCN